MLPPNARRIKRARDVGQHPDEITIVYSTRWCGRRYGPDAVIVLAPAYAGGEYDPFSWCAGIATLCINHDGDDRGFLRLLADVAAWAAPTWAKHSIDDDVHDASDVLWSNRWPRRDQEWPDGWGAELERAYLQRLQRYLYVHQRRDEGKRA